MITDEIHNAEYRNFPDSFMGHSVHHNTLNHEHLIWITALLWKGLKTRCTVELDFP